MVQIVVVDTETTGMDHAKDTVVEIAAVSRRREFLGVFSSLCNPGRPIPPEAMAVHHITDSMAADQPLLSANLVDLLRKLDEDRETPDEPRIWAAHNAEFDRGFLQGLEGGWICTWRCALHIWPDAPGHGNQVLRYWLKLDPQIPSDLYPHRALYDAVVTEEILQLMLTMHSVEELQRMTVTPVLLRKVRFGKHRDELWEKVPRDYLRWLIRQTELDPDVRHTVQHYLEH